MHASTFGGNPIAARAGIAAIEMIEREQLLQHGQAMSALFRQRLQELAETCNLIQEVRICGLMIGLELSVEGAPIVRGCLERQLLINCTHNTVIRLLPALNVTAEQVHAGSDILADVLRQHAG